MAKSRWFLKFLLWMGAALVALLIFGPRPAVELPPMDLKVPQDPQALEVWIAAREKAQDPPVRPGLEKEIRWASPRKTKTPLAVVYLPGFGATKGEIQPVPDLVARALGANLFYSRPADSGQGPEAFRNVTARDWLADAVEGWQVGRVLGDQVIILATSTGGTVATWLATRPEAKNLRALILVSPNYEPRDPRAFLLLWPWSNVLTKLIQGDYREFQPSNPLVARFWETKQASDALVPMAGLAHFAKNLDLGSATVPLLLFYSLEDPTTNPEIARQVFQRFPSRVKESIEVFSRDGESSHVLAGDAYAPSYTPVMTQKILEFLKKLP